MYEEPDPYAVLMFRIGLVLGVTVMGILWAICEIICR